jgi:D-aminoacyl-tRNA deacylase
MISVIQRVRNATVLIENNKYASISQGILIFLGVTHTDTEEDADWLSKKIVNLRIFDNQDGVMNLSFNDLPLESLVVSQFTLHAKTKKGNRPSYIEAAKPPLALDLYEYFINQMNVISKNKTKSGVFGANMQVNLCNDGPVTIIIDTKNKK